MLLVIEIERDTDGWHSVVIDLSDDSVVHISDSYPNISDAVRASQRWIQRNG